MKKHSKRYIDAREKTHGKKNLSVKEGVDLLKSLEGADFDETVELAINLGVDPRKADQMIRGSFALPHGTGKSRTVIAFVEGEEAKKAEEAGAAEVGGKELVEKIQDGWLDFDVAISTPAMMKHVRKLGRILGPQGMMPSPKSGTVAEDVAKAVKEFIAGKIEFRVDAGAVLHVPVGKKSFPPEKLVENIDAFLEFVLAQRPVSAKGIFMKKVTLSSTMSPGIDLQTRSKN